MPLSTSYAGSESERLLITEAYRAGRIDRETYVVDKLASYFSRDNLVAQRLADSSGTNGREVTILLKEARLDLDRYDTESRDFVSALLKRPTDSDYEDIVKNFYLPDPEVFEPSADAYPNIGGKFKIWYTISDTEAGGGPHTATTEFVTAVAEAMEQVYKTEITDLGYPVPPDDGDGTANGGDEKFDIYLMNCGRYGIYGYTAAEGLAEDTDEGADTNGYYAFMVIDNDFEEFELFGTIAEEAMQVTLAHEYHHVIQMGLNVNASSWYMEATATWMEDQVFDDVDDNQQYLSDFFGHPEIPLDDEASAYHLYGAWIWNEYLETSWNQALVQSIWDRLDPIGSNSAMDAISAELVSRDDTLQSAFSEFVTVNYSKTGFYKDAEDSFYEDVSTESTHALGTGSADEVSGSVVVDHLASNYIEFTPKASGDSTLVISIDGEDNGTVDAVAIQKTTDGDFIEYPFSFIDTTLESSVFISGFSTADTDEVMLILLNYSRSNDAMAVDYSAVLETESSSEGGGGCFIGTIFGY
jgi:hypothetical protein